MNMSNGTAERGHYFLLSGFQVRIFSMPEVGAAATHAS